MPDGQRLDCAVKVMWIYNLGTTIWLCSNDEQGNIVVSNNYQLSTVQEFVMLRVFADEEALDKQV